jgi:hypothetical protein
VLCLDGRFASRFHCRNEKNRSSAHLRHDWVQQMLILRTRPLQEKKRKEKEFCTRASRPGAADAHSRDLAILWYSVLFQSAILVILISYNINKMTSVQHPSQYLLIEFLFGSTVSSSRLACRVIHANQNMEIPTVCPLHIFISF